MKKSRAFLVVVAAVWLSAPALAQRAAAPDWGLDSPSILNVYAWEFEPLDSRIVLGPTASGSFLRYAVSSTAPFPEGYVEAPVHLPTGVVIDKIEIAGCDDIHDALSAVLYYTDDPASPSVALGTATLPLAFCGYTSSDPINHEVDNSSHSYGIEVHLFVGNASVGLRSVRVYYHRQVSPAPATATFNDVPIDHPFFQYIEALAASGITGGCGNGNFCPNAPVTRGQMATFLAKALGLHFPY
jgi:hypothetical protein